MNAAFSGLLIVAAWGQGVLPPAPAEDVFSPDSGEECRAIDDPFGVIQPLFQRLVDVSSMPTAPLIFYTGKDDLMSDSIGGNMPPVNRDPEGKVFVGPFLLHVVAQSPDEVAFVLAHEIAHIKFDHSRLKTRRYAEYENHIREHVQGRRHASMNAASGRRSDDEINERLDEEYAAFVRAQEREADRDAVRLMARAGFDAAAGARLMDRWGRIDPNRRHAMFQPLNTHDPPFQRARSIAETASRIQGGPVCGP